MSGLSKRLQKSNKLSKILTLPPQFFLKSNGTGSSKCLPSPLRKNQFESDNVVPLTPRYANILIDGYIHMPGEVLTYQSETDSAITLIQGMLCISLANPTLIEDFDIQVVGNLSYDLTKMSTISEHNEVCFEDNKQVDIPILNLKQLVKSKEYGARNHYIPFEFLISKAKDNIDLPPSFSSSEGSISYLIKANIKFRNSSKQFNLVQPFLLRKCSLPYNLEDTQLLTPNPSNEGLHPLDHQNTIDNNTTSTQTQFHSVVEIDSGLIYDLKVPKHLHPKQKYSPAHLRITKMESNQPLPTKCTCSILQTQTFQMNPKQKPKVIENLIKVQDIPLKSLTSKDQFKIHYADPLLWLHSGLNLHHTVQSTYDPKLNVKHQLVLDFKFSSNLILGKDRSKRFTLDVDLLALHPKLKDQNRNLELCPPPYLKPPLYKPLLSPLLSPYHFNLMKR